MHMELLLKKVTREISMCHVSIPVFVPRLRTIARYIISEIINKAAIQWVAARNNAFRVRHASWMSGFNRQI